MSRFAVSCTRAPDMSTPHDMLRFGITLLFGPRRKVQTGRSRHLAREPAVNSLRTSSRRLSDGLFPEAARPCRCRWARRCAAGARRSNSATAF